MPHSDWLCLVSPCEQVEHTVLDTFFTELLTCLMAASEEHISPATAERFHAGSTANGVENATRFRGVRRFATQIRCLLAERRFDSLQTVWNETLTEIESSHEIDARYRGLGLKIDSSCCSVDCAALRESLRSAERLLSRAPAYHQWVRSVIDTIEAVMPPTCGFISGSATNKFGHVLVSTNVSGLDTFETLVHESAHQYFFVASMIDPVVRDESTLHTSPLKSTPRPASRILLSWHALANIVAAYAETGGPESSETSTRIARYLNQVTALADIIENEIPLTPFGDMMYETLAERTQLLRDAFA